MSEMPTYPEALRAALDALRTLSEVAVMEARGATFAECVLSVQNLTDASEFDERHVGE